MNLIIIDFIRKYKLILVLLIGFITGTLLNCNKPKEIVKTTTKIEYVVKNHTDTIKTKPKVEYKYKTKTVTITNTDTIIKSFKPKDYEWTYDKTNFTKDNKTSINIKASGWGNLDKLDYIINTKDTTKVVTNTIEKTIIKNANALYLSGSYLSNKNIGVNLDWTIKNKIILGGVVEYDNLSKQPIVGAKLGIKL